MKIEFDLTERDIDQLRWIMNHLPLSSHAPLVVAILKALPAGSRGSLPESYIDSIPESAYPPADPAAGTGSRSSLSGCGFSICAVSEQGRAAMPYLESRLLWAGIPWTRGEL